MPVGVGTVTREGFTPFASGRSNEFTTLRNGFARRQAAKQSAVGSIDPEAAASVPVLNGLLGIFVEGAIVRPDIGNHPIRLVAEHQMHALGRDGQLRVDGRREGVDELRPCRIVEPERGAAFLAEMALARARLAVPA